MCFKYIMSPWTNNIIDIKYDLDFASLCVQYGSYDYYENRICFATNFIKHYFIKSIAIVAIIPKMKQNKYDK